jgi:hypothetical protein
MSFGREDAGWLCVHCREGQHCDGATVQCDCTCTWPVDWAEAEMYRYEPPPRADRNLEDLTWGPEGSGRRA